MKTQNDQSRQQENRAAPSQEVGKSAIEEYAVDARDVEITYADGTEAVRGVTLRVPRGEFFGFLGANGAGKTTTIKALATLLQPTAGAISVNGVDALEDTRTVRRSVGYMAQETSVDPELTAQENLVFACRAYGVPRSERDERIDELLALVDLGDVADKQAKTFSGGMAKRLDVATALVHRPPLIFLDEPTTGLDPKARNRLWEYFRGINAEGTTVFLTTQYLEEADQLADRIAVLLDGRIVADGTPTELKARVGGDILAIELEDGDDARTRARGAIVRSRFVTDDDTVEITDAGVSVASSQVRDFAMDVLLALREADVAVTGFDIRSPTLDDVFLTVVDEPPSTDSADEGFEPAETGDRTADAEAVIPATREK